VAGTVIWVTTAPLTAVTTAAVVVVGPAGRAFLAELALPAVQRAIVTDCLALIDAISPLVARLERDLLARARPDPRV
jgi:hypothetical protein